ncbi:phytoene/squalene synthase family protein [Aliiruegeria sabulilitoris]|uniref:phytoene/squalene synthase family protein n=1 Tax=Aliiruegeria sabulilitoris TaxID=1510458 RepID=UPI00082F0BFE|nr:squalene/phytoene synthase family protein [Aliiruegeria sabulilitoris]NDR55002.1 phytoene synthase [Pseudoruegeria sp. M32A2M]
MSISDCAAIVEKGDPDRFMATMAAPVSAREVLFPLYAFNVEVTRIPWVSQEPMICEMRLQWWHDVLGEIAAGEPVRAHEVAEPLTEMLRARAVPVEPLQALVEARRWDVYRDAFEDEAAFRAYIEASAAGMMWVAALALGASPEAEKAVRDVGWAAGLAAFLRAIPELEARGRRPLHDGRPEVVAALASEGLARLKDARTSGVPKPAIPALRAGWRARATLEKAAADPSRVAEGALEESPFARRFTLLRKTMIGSW